MQQTVSKTKNKNEVQRIYSFEGETIIRRKG